MIRVNETVSLGRYNNQWMVVDYKLFVPGQEYSKQGLFTVLEQIP